MNFYGLLNKRGCIKNLYYGMQNAQTGRRRMQTILIFNKIVCVTLRHQRLVIAILTQSITDYLIMILKKRI